MKVSFWGEIVSIGEILQSPVMFDPIIKSPAPVTLVGGGEATPEDLQKALNLAPTCVAADGGAVLADRSGVTLDALIGDFDSVGEDLLAAVPPTVVHHVAEQDSTDFEKALTRISAPVVVGVGFLGKRVDHQLAAFHTLMVCADRACVLLGPAEVVCLAPPQLSLPTQTGDIVSLFPLGAVRGDSTGLTWPIKGLCLAPGVQSGTSNRAEGPMTLSVDAPRLLLILPRRLMPDLVSALGAPHAARWSAPA